MQHGLPPLAGSCARNAADSLGGHPMKQVLWEQARIYGAQIRNTNASRSKLDAALRKSTCSEAREYNEALIYGWEDRDEYIRRTPAPAR